MASSPFLIKVGDPGKVEVAHVRSEELFAERVIKNEVDLAVESPYDMNDDEFSANVTSPDGENVPCHVSKGTDNRHHVKFTPHKPGPYKVSRRRAACGLMTPDREVWVQVLAGAFCCALGQDTLLSQSALSTQEYK